MDGAAVVLEAFFVGQASSAAAAPMKSIEYP
jgi:hypothetical protein